MRLIQYVFLLLILFYQFKTEAKKRNLPSALSAVNQLNRSSMSSCKIKNDDDDVVFQQKFFCQRPLIKASGCSRKVKKNTGPGDCSNCEMDYTENQSTSIAEMDCHICGESFHVIAKVGRIAPGEQADFGDDYETRRKENEGDNYTPPGPPSLSPQGLDFRNIRTSADFNKIKNACLNLINNKMESTDISGFAEMHDEESIKEIKNFGDIFKNQTSSVFEGQIDFQDFLSTTGKVCKTDKDEDDEVDQYIKNLAKSNENSVTLKEEILETNFYLFTRTVGIKNNPILEKQGLSHLVGAFSYMINGSEKNKQETEKNIDFFIFNNPAFEALKLNNEDTKSKVFHLVFDQEPPNAQQLEKSLNTIAQLPNSQRVINPQCDAEKVQHLNISVKTGNKISVKRYILSCRSNNGKKAFTLKEIIQ